jgi:hypothetical protein
LQLGYDVIAVAARGHLSSLSCGSASSWRAVTKADAR